MNEEDPLLKCFSGKIGEIIFNHHKKQFFQHIHYTAKINEETEERTTYNVFRDHTIEEDILEKGRVVVWKENEIICSCKKYLITGIICRHLFVVAKLRQHKDLSNFIHYRWRISQSEGVTSHSFTEEENEAELKKDLKRKKRRRGGRESFKYQRTSKQE